MPTHENLKPGSAAWPAAANRAVGIEFRRDDERLPFSWRDLKREAREMQRGD
jgi:hypothetical protein